MFQTYTGILAVDWKNYIRIGGDVDYFACRNRLDIARGEKGKKVIP